MAEKKRLAIGLRALFLLVTFLCMLFVILIEFWKYKTFTWSIGETIENIKWSEDQLQGKRIISVLKNSTIDSVRRPVIADARLINRHGSDKPSSVAIDWIGDNSDVVKGVGLRFTDGETVELPVNVAWIERGPPFYFQIEFSMDVADLAQANEISDVWLIYGDGKTTNRMKIRKYQRTY